MEQGFWCVHTLGILIVSHAGFCANAARCVSLCPVRIFMLASVVLTEICIDFFFFFFFFCHVKAIL